MKKNSQQTASRRGSSDIGLSEILITFDRLAPKSEETKAEIIKLLGFEWANTMPVSTDWTEDTSSLLMQPAVSEKVEKEVPITAHPKRETPSAAISLTPTHRIEPQTLEEIDFLQADLNDSKILSETRIDLHFKKPQYTPLLHQKWFQGIMSAMLSTQIQTRSLDLKLIEKSLSQLSPIDDVPYLYRTTLNKGVQVLLDTSISMQPFWRDESELINSLYRLFNIHKTHIYEFELSLYPVAQLIWNTGFPPYLQEETPVLLVTNFGATINIGLNTIQECTDITQLLEQAEMKKCPVAALIPAATKDYPKDISKLIPFTFPWDQETSPQKVNTIKRR